MRNLNIGVHTYKRIYHKELLDLVYSEVDLMRLGHEFNGSGNGSGRFGILGGEFIRWIPAARGFRYLFSLGSLLDSPMSAYFNDESSRRM